jgi:3-hydroxybutyrate dehydrogenase
MEPGLAGRRAAVTGAASGIGAACARALADHGASVVLLDRDAEGVTALAAELGGTSQVVDLGDPSAVDAIGLEADILVNNAGFQHVAAVHEFPTDVFDSMMQVMVRTPFALARQVLPSMYDRGWGRVVNISSIHGRRASAYKVGYITAKHALEGLSKVVALEGGPKGVTSNCIAPSYVRTPLVERQVAAQARERGIDESAVVQDVMLARPAVQRLVEPDEVASLLLYLCSPQGQMITGASLALDGGWTAQ